MTSRRSLQRAIMLPLLVAIGLLFVPISSASADTGGGCKNYTQSTLRFRVCLFDLSGTVDGTLSVQSGGNTHATGHIRVYEGKEPGAKEQYACPSVIVTLDFNDEVCQGFINDNAYYHATWVGAGGKLWPSPQFFFQEG
jgi:hypothetical protein